MKETDIKLAFYVSSKATRLNKILDDKNFDLLNAVKVIFSDDDKNIYLKEKLNELNIEYVLLNYKDIVAERSKKNLVLSNTLLNTLTRYNIDYCFSFGAHILKGELLKEYENRIINFHPSILPAYPGIMSIDQAVEGNANLLGNTAHFIDSGVDTGPIIMQSVIHSTAFRENGYDAVLDIQIDMLYKIYDLLRKGKIKVVDNRVRIEGANYNTYSIFPYL